MEILRKFLSEDTIMKIIIGILIVGLVLIVSFIYFLIYSIVGILLPSILAHLVAIGLLVKIIKVGITGLLFPGSFWLRKRYMELTFTKFHFHSISGVFRVKLSTGLKISQ